MVLVARQRACLPRLSLANYSVLVSRSMQQNIMSLSRTPRARGAGHELREGGPAELVVDAGVRLELAGGGETPALPGGAPLVVLCAATSLAARGEPGAVGFHLLPPLDDARLVELTRLPTTPSFACEAAERFFAGLGFLCEWVEDAPGLGARPHRRSARERGGVRYWRRRLGRRRGHRPHARPIPPARARRLERCGRPRPRSGRPRRPLARATRGALPSRPPASSRGRAWRSLRD